VSIHFANAGRPCFIYVADLHMPIVAARSRHRYDLFKVGITESPPSRLASIRTGSPFPVFMTMTRKLPTRELARHFERRFHQENAKWRLEGEWFWYIRTGACCDIDTMIAEYWFDRHGRNGLHEFLMSTGMSEDAATDTILASFGEEDNCQWG